MQKFESQFAIGDPVNVSMSGASIPGHIRTVLFTNAKVRYSVKTLEDSTLHIVDSIYVVPREGIASCVLFDPADNYS